MKHFFLGVLFLLFLFTPPQSFASINITISDLSQKEDYYELNALVTGMTSSSKTFVEGMFTSQNDNNYFGYTLSRKGEWLIYDGSPDKTLVIENFIELFNDIPQKIYVKPDYEDKDYIGPGKYLIKLKRFTASGSPSDYSNILELNLIKSTPTPTSSLTTQLTPTTLPASSATSPTSSPPKISTATPPASTPTKSQTLTPTSKITSTPVIPAHDEISKTNPSPTNCDLRSENCNLNISPQVLSASTSADDGVIPAKAGIHKFDSATPSSFPISDKNLFLVGMVTFSVSGGVLYFRLKNL